MLVYWLAMYFDKLRSGDMGVLAKYEQKSLGVTSTDGWTTNRGIPGHMVLYRDHNRAGENTVRIAIEEEVPDAPSNITIMGSEWLWGRPYLNSRAEVDAADRKIIVSRVVEALAFLGNHVLVLPSVYGVPISAMGRECPSGETSCWRRVDGLEWRYADTSGIELVVRLVRLDGGTLGLVWSEYMCAVQSIVSSHAEGMSIDMMHLAGMLLNEVVSTGDQCVIIK
jgi:hypothetical protein